MVQDWLKLIGSLALVVLLLIGMYSYEQNKIDDATSSSNLIATNLTITNIERQSYLFGEYKVSLSNGSVVYIERNGKYDPNIEVGEDNVTLTKKGLIVLTWTGERHLLDFYK